jgi:hypothetical protein
MTVIIYNPSANSGLYSTVAVTASGVEHVAHFDQTNNKLLYTTGSLLGPYTTTTPDTTTNQTGYSGKGLALSSTGTPTLSYLAMPAAGGFGWLDFATVPGAPAPIDGPTANVSAGQDSNLKIAPNGTIHVISYDQLNGFNAFRHVMRVGTSWSLVQVTSSSEVIPGNTTNYMDLDSSGNPNFFYSHYVNPGSPTAYTELVWARYLSGVWTTTVVPNVPHTGSFPAFAFDTAGHAHVIYVGNATGSGLGHATNTSGAWTFELINPSFNVNDEHQAVAVDQTSGRIHVVYGDAGLQYARKDPGGSWVLRTLDSAALARFPSIALDSTGMIHVAYYDGILKRLKIMSGTP